MNTLIPILIGAFVLCGMPIASFVAGMWFIKYGSPLRVEWRGFNRHSSDEEELD